MKKLTLQWLIDKRACPLATGRFERLFGQECEASAANAYRWINSADFERGVNSLTNDLFWLALRLLVKMDIDGPIYVRSLPLATKVARYLGFKIPRGMSVAYAVLDAMRIVLRKGRLANAIEQIAERSPNL